MRFLNIFILSDLVVGIVFVEIGFELFGIVQNFFIISDSHLLWTNLESDESFISIGLEFHQKALNWKMRDSPSSISWNESVFCSGSIRKKHIGNRVPHNRVEFHQIHPRSLFNICNIKSCISSNFLEIEHIVVFVLRNNKNIEFLFYVLNRDTDTKIFFYLRKMFIKPISIFIVHMGWRKGNHLYLEGFCHFHQFLDFGFGNSSFWCSNRENRNFKSIRKSFKIIFIDSIVVFFLDYEINSIKFHFFHESKNLVNSISLEA